MNPQTIRRMSTEPSKTPVYDAAIVAYMDLMCRVALSFTHDSERARLLVESALAKVLPTGAADCPPATKSRLLAELRRSFMAEQALCGIS